MTIDLRLCAAVRGYAMLGNEVFDADGATFVRNRACPNRYDSNFVTDIRCRDAAELARLMERVEREFAGFAHRQFHVDPLTPPAVAAHFAMADFPFTEQLVMVLEGEVRAELRPLEVRAVQDEAGWEDYASLLRADWDETLRRQGKPPAPEVTAEFLIAKRCKAPEAQFWVAYVEGRPVSQFSSWATPDGVGLLEDLFTLPDFRRRGIATTLLAHCAADTRRRGAGPIALSALVDDTPKHLYAALGFVPAHVQRVYTRAV